ncbi:MAG: DNA-directed RNA polymerase subunit alpha [Patescibacteria group bacterium]|jgi:DNA-directed RNA polymerase subunit alpha
MERIQLPSKISFTDTEPNVTDVVIEPCFPGYGTTLGNALRRVLLSSLPGAAITAVKITNATHEFATVPHVKEDVVDLILNLKGVRLAVHEGEGGTVMLKVKGEKVATAGDIKCPANIEIRNPEHVIATLTDKAADLEIECTVGVGRGYVPVEQREKERLDLGVIAVDAIYTPVRNVNFAVEHVRVGQMTNYDKVTLTIRTDGTITPAAAFGDATHILVDHFQHLLESVPAVAVAEVADEKPAKKKKATKKEKAEDAE